MRALMIALVVLAVGAPVASAASPSQAARTTRACLADRGWHAWLADHGRTVNAQAPRHRATYPTHPWFSVAFSRTDGQTFGIEIRLALNRRENATATFCKRKGLR